MPTKDLMDNNFNANASRKLRTQLLGFYIIMIMLVLFAAVVFVAYRYYVFLFDLLVKTMSTDNEQNSASITKSFFPLHKSAIRFKADR